MPSKKQLARIAVPAFCLLLLFYALLWRPPLLNIGQHAELFWQPTKTNAVVDQNNQSVPAASLTVNVKENSHKAAVLVEDTLNQITETETGTDSEPEEDSTSSPPIQSTEAQSQVSPEVVAETKVKLILLWSNTHGIYGSGDFTNDVMLSECPIRDKCKLTTDHSLIEKASAVLFHWPEVVRGLSPPPVRHSWQRYVMVTIEPAGYYPAVSSYENHFNWTLTYRTDSTFPLLYGYTADGPSRNYHASDVKNLVQGKTKMMAWFVSNCGTPSRRESYVRLLKKYVPVDVYGSCGDKRCPRRDGRELSDCHKMVEREYFFYLGFENSICKDYVTEKLFKFLTINVVPIVLSRLVASAVAPNSSFIAVDDFKSPEELANYLKYLASNATAYMEYFAWKQKRHAVSWHNWAYAAPEAPNLGYCAMCKALHNSSWPAQTVQLRQWWTEEAKCRSVVL